MSGRLNYEYDIIAQSGEALERKTEVFSYRGKWYLTTLCEDVEPFKADFTEQLAVSVTEMMNVRTKKLIDALAEYKVVLDFANQNMEESDESIASGISSGGAI